MNAASTGRSPGERAPSLLCITPSPAIDRTARVPRLLHGEVLRPTHLAVLPGGKGLNAARAARRLGARVTTTGIAGGHVGRWIEEALEREGLAPRFAPAEAESRTTYVTIDARGDSLLVYERAAEASAAEFEAFLRLLEAELLPEADRAIVAGSLPAGIAPEAYADIVILARRARRPLLVDTSDAALCAAVAAGPDIVKVSRGEVVAAGIVGRDASAVAAALALVRRGARFALVTDGSAPAAATDGERTWVVRVPAVRAVNAVGSGDAVDAALSMALAEGADIEVALARSIAAGAANALSFSGGDVDPATVERLQAEVDVAVLSATGK